MSGPFSGQTEFAAGSVFGFRNWVYDPRRQQICGMYNWLWPPREKVYLAKCSRLIAWFPDKGKQFIPEHDVPSPDVCSCGFYAYWKPSPCISPNPDRIIGVIEGFGRTLIGNRGFRSEKARITGLCIPDSSSLSKVVGIHKSLSEKYDVPVYTDEEELLASCPLTTEYYQETTLDDIRKQIQDLRAAYMSSTVTLNQVKSAIDDIERENDRCRNLVVDSIGRVSCAEGTVPVQEDA